MVKISEFYTPIFYKDGNLIVFVSSAFMSESESGARALGELTSAGVEIITGAEFTGEALLVSHGQRHVPARLAGREIAVLSGPAFTRIAARQSAAVAA